MIYEGLINVYSEGQADTPSALAGPDDVNSPEMMSPGLSKEISEAAVVATQGQRDHWIRGGGGGSQPPLLPKVH